MTQPPQPPPPSNNPYGNPNPYGNGGQQWPVAQPGPGGGYQGYGYQPPPPSKGSGKTIGIIVGIIVLVILLFCGGIIGVIAWAVNNVEDSFNDFDPDRSGGRNNPITVEAGEAFEIDGIEYAEGWTIEPPEDEYSGNNIAGLKGTNDREDESSEYVSLTFTFVDADDIEVGEIRCHSDGNISYDRSENLDCTSSQPIEGEYDQIEVNAS